MTRFKPILLIAAAAFALTALIRSRTGESAPVDRGGWKAVDPT